VARGACMLCGCGGLRKGAHRHEGMEAGTERRCAVLGVAVGLWGWPVRRGSVGMRAGERALSDKAQYWGASVGL